MKIVQGIVLVAFAAGLSLASWFGASALKWSQELPDLEPVLALEFTATSEVFARDGTRIGSIVPVTGEDRASTNRIPVGLDEISPAALQAIVAYEDDRYFEHYGFDMSGIARAFYEEFVGSGGRGGSSITTQVVKNTVLADIRDERSMERKAKELLLAIELERRLTKAEILQRYVNVVFWGGNVYGIRAAAQTYFGKDPIELNLAEGLYLARLIPAPNARHDDFETTRASMRNVLDRMVQRGTISREAAERTWRYPLEPRGWAAEYETDGSLISAEQTGDPVVVQQSISSELNWHVVVAVRNWLLDRFGEAAVFGRGGLRITTTIDVQAQTAANAASLDAQIPDGAELGIVALDPYSGEVLAMVGEKLEPGVREGEFNRVTQAQRQPGSSFKPITYATAIEEAGFTQATILVDKPTEFQQRGEPPYEPVNHDGSFIGPATVRQHLDLSRNIPAVKALEAASAEAVAERARELGYDVEPYYSMALGSFEVSPLRHASAFTSFTNGGVHVEPHFVRRVEDAEGNVLYQADPRRSRVWTEETAYVMLDLLHANVVDRNPTAFSWRAQLEGRWVGGKTGTTNDEKDIWFVGTTPEITAAVWIGNDQGESLPRSMTLPDGSTDQVNSSRQPIYVWKDFMEAALRGQPADQDGFPVPEGITFQTFDRDTGAASSAGTRAAFPAGEELPRRAFASALSVELPIDQATGMRATADTPADRIEVVRVAPSEIDQYLPAGDGAP
ncbi:MAG: transglycosylase domain-containing protein [Trueperaceae bacterium]|nr:transglycosylase domain-containing protein [Trueperaceae bacterium]